ncbi:hypothetical protein GCM10022237_06240 [Nocardioides ginsengisoli]
MDSDVRVAFCHVCEEPTEHLDVGDRTIAAGGAVELAWWRCKECGAENLG